MARDLENLGLVDQNCLEREWFILLPSALAVGRRQQSMSIGAALDMESGDFMMKCFDIGLCHADFLL